MFFKGSAHFQLNEKILSDVMRIFSRPVERWQNIERNKQISVEGRARREDDSSVMDLARFVPNLSRYLAIEPLGAQPASQED